VNSILVTLTYYGPSHVDMFPGGRIGAVLAFMRSSHPPEEAGDRPPGRKIRKPSRREQKRIRKVSGDVVPCHSHLFKI